MTAEPEKKDKPNPAAARELAREASLARLREVVAAGELNDLQAAIRRHVAYFPETEELSLPTRLYARLRRRVEQQGPRSQTVKTAADGSLFVQKTMIVEGPDNGQ